MTNTTEEATDLWICSEPFASAAGMATRDMVLRADDPIYLSNPSAFQPFGTPDSERHHYAESFLVAQEKAANDAKERAEAEFQRQAEANPLKLEAELPKIYRAASDIACYLDGRPSLVQKNSTVLQGHALLASHPDAFVPVSRR